MVDVVLPGRMDHHIWYYSNSCMADVATKRTGEKNYTIRGGIIRKKVSREDKKKYKQRLHDVEISDSLGEKIKKVSKKIKWYQKIPNKKNEGIFRRKLFKEL